MLRSRPLVLARAGATSRAAQGRSFTSPLGATVSRSLSSTTRTSSEHSTRQINSTFITVLFALGSAGLVSASWLDLGGEGSEPSTNALRMESSQAGAAAGVPGGIQDGKLRLVPRVFLWGRNTDLVVSPPTLDSTTSSTSSTPSSPSPTSALSTTTTTSSDFVKKPSAPLSLSSMILRDLQLSRSYGVALDSTGQAIQWGKGFSPSGAVEYTVRDKDLVRVEPTEQGKVFGLDKRGDVWVWSSSKAHQRIGGVEREGKGQHEAVGSAVSSSGGSNKWWWLGQGTVWGTGASGNAVECRKLKPDVALAKGEKFVSLSSGASHLLALTSSGRSFAVPLSLAANDYGQLGVRSVSLLTPLHPSSAPTSELKVRLEPDERINEMGRDKLPPMPKNLDPLLLPPTAPRSKSDPSPAPSASIPSPPALLQPQRQVRPDVRLAEDDEAHSALERSINFCTTLHEIPSLKGVPVVELVAGRHHSLARLGGRAEGRVLGWGAGAYGQLGLGPSLSFPSIPTPTEIPILRSPAYSATKPTVARCVKIAAGGNLSYFVVETERQGRGLGVGKEGVKRETDLLASGQGQFGGLGNGLWAHATHPLRVKTVSGLTEWNEATGQVESIGIKDIQAGETHVAVVLDNAVEFPGGIRFGRDVFTFGQNEFYQLGNGKRASLSTPQHLPPLPYPSALKNLATVDSEGNEGTLVVKQEESLSSGTTSPMPHKRLQLATELPIPPGTRGISKKAKVEETVVTGDSSTGVYWKIIEP
ncbi:hypothetical protein JCM10212_001106 [Sporobolomyces blumeae]